MIFVTIGTQLPFPRLIEAVAALVPELDEEVVAQIGPDTGTYAGITSHKTLSPPEYSALFKRARIVVAHAGIGTILTAKARRKPLLLVPRRHAMGEHRNDHQMATARQVESLQGVHIAWDETELARLLKDPQLAPAQPGPGPKADALIERLRQEITKGKT